MYQPPPLAPREAWNARPPSRPLPNTILPVDVVLLEQTGGEECHVKCMKRVANIQSFEMDAEGLEDISYNFLIGSDGVVYVGRGWYKQGEDASPGIIVVAFIGDFYYQAKPNKNQLEAFENLLEMGLNLNLLVEDVVVAGTCDKTTPNSSEYSGFKLLLSDRRVPYSQCTDYLVAPGERVSIVN